MRSCKNISFGTLILAYLLASLPLSGCGYVAAGAAGAVIGHEIAKDDEEDGEDE